MLSVFKTAINHDKITNEHLLNPTLQTNVWMLCSDFEQQKNTFLITNWTRIKKSI